MSLATINPANIKNRLLPASLPFRFFAASAGFHILAWILLFLGASDLPDFTGGPGWVLASLHLLTLGVLTMSAMGAAYQLLPVATGRAIARNWPIKLSFWLFTPGTLMLAWGMIDSAPALLYPGSFGVATGLIIFAILTADNLWRARSSMPVVTAHGWAALVALAGLVALGIILVADFDIGFLDERQAISVAHMVLAIFGFMGLLVFGFSQILVPMFMLSRALPTAPGWFELALSALAIALATIGALVASNSLIISAGLVGIIAAGAYLWLMRSAYRTAMRKRLGLSFILIRLSWMILIIGIATSVVVATGTTIKNGTTLFVFLMLAGWLLTFITGILQRIMPFLASMHKIGLGGRPPLLSELTAERPLVIHAVCHICALALCSAGIVLEMPVIIQSGALFGIAGAVAFSGFAGYVVYRLSMPDHS